MQVGTALLIGLATVGSALSPAAPQPQRPAPAPVVSTTRPVVDDAIEGVALPERLRVPNRALLVGADERMALYHSGHYVPGSHEIVYTLVSLTDGAVVRTFRSPPTAADVADVRLSDGSVVVVDRHTSRATRSDAGTGAVTGSVQLPAQEEVVALDDEWIMTRTAVHHFDGRVVSLTGPALPATPFDVLQLGDSDMAVLATFRGARPVVVTPGTGAVVALEDSAGADSLQVFAARGGPHPEVYAFGVAGGESGLVRWSDPAHGGGRTVVGGSVVSSIGGGFAGDRLLVNRAGEHDATGGSLVEVDPTTGALGPVVVTDTWIGAGSESFGSRPGERVEQAADGLVVSLGGSAEGGLTLVTANGVRALGAPTPSPLSATTVFQDAGRIQATFQENDVARGSAQLDPGASTWTDLPGQAAPPALPDDPPSAPLAPCPEGASSDVLVVRGRWQLEYCASRRWVTDRRGLLAPLDLGNTEAQLGTDHVAHLVVERDGNDHRVALAVTDLDARHRSRVYGPLFPSDLAYSVDLTSDRPPVYVDASGRVRVAAPSGLVDTTGPVLGVTVRPQSYVSSVVRTRLTYSGHARDAVDGGQVTTRVQTRRALTGSGRLSAWHAQSTSSRGSFSLTARPGEQWCFRLAAYDRSGNVRVSTPSCSVVPTDDRGSERSARARRVTGDYLGGAATVLAGPGAVLTTRTRPGSRVVVWLRTGPSRGTLVVRDGSRVVQRVDTRARRPGLRVVVLSPVGRPLRLGSSGSSPVVVDAIGHRRPS